MNKNVLVDWVGHIIYIFYFYLILYIIIYYYLNDRDRDGPRERMDTFLYDVVFLLKKLIFVTEV